MKCMFLLITHDERSSNLLEIPGEAELVEMEQTCQVEAHWADIFEAAGAKAADAFETGVQVPDIGQESDIDQKQGLLPYIVGCTNADNYSHMC